MVNTLADSSDLTQTYYRFAEKKHMVDRYLDERKSAQEVNKQGVFFIEPILYTSALFAGAFLSKRFIFPSGVGLRLLRDAKAGPFGYWKTRLPPIVLFGFCAYMLKQNTYKPNPYSTGELP